MSSYHKCAKSDPTCSGLKTGIKAYHTCARKKNCRKEDFHKRVPTPTPTPKPKEKLTSGIPTLKKPKPKPKPKPKSKAELMFENELEKYKNELKAISKKVYSKKKLETKFLSKKKIIKYLNNLWDDDFISIEKIYTPVRHKLNDNKDGYYKDIDEISNLQEQFVKKIKNTKKEIRKKDE